MVTVTDKPATVRAASASAQVHIAAAALRTLRRGGGAKGEVLEIARIAGIAAAKRTWDLIPLCHPLPLSTIEVDAGYVRGGIELRSHVAALASTGVEMEALTAVSVAALTVYDMAKALGHEITFDVRLDSKSGGRTGIWKRPR